MNYQEFLKTKKIKLEPVGIDIDNSKINHLLFDFQKDIVRWAVRRGRCAIFLDTGLGKTFCQLEWARLIGGKSLIVAPLSVARQTIKEGKKINAEVNFAHDKSQLVNGINITNYELLDNFDADIDSIVLDESSILKSIGGKIKQKLINKFESVKYKLCCTATPAPNDYIELGNHAQFLGISTHQEMLSMFFINANKEHTFIFNNTIITKKGSNKGGTEWRIKHHAEKKFFEWLAAWAIFMTKPSDLGYDDNGFILPELTVKPIFIKTKDYHPKGSLFFMGLSGVEDRVNVRKDMIEIKGSELKRLVDGSDEQWIIWCGLDKESSFVKKTLPENISIEVSGIDSVDKKVEAFESFQDGKIQVLITKPKIGAFGMNFQNANNMIFFGLSDSWETYYQAIRREWRFGQTKPVNVYILLTQEEKEIYENVMRKEKGAYRLRSEMIKLIKNFEKEELMNLEHEEEEYTEETIETANYKAMRGDCTVRLKEINDCSIDLSVYSPPFADLFVYSNSERDLGNSRGWDDFFKHYSFVIQELFRVTKSGRLSCVHTSDIPAMANRDGYIGLRDFPGKVIQAHEENGWVFVGRSYISKNPQAQAIRTHSQALLFAQLKRDSSSSRPALFDQILIFKKPGENAIPITPVKNGEMDNETWIDWASGNWTGIHETNTLQYYCARDKGDEKHICPLQLETIERCIKLYSNPGEIILTPFMGIGSEAFMAVKLGRKAKGIELKKSYFDIAINNLNSIQKGLF